MHDLTCPVCGDFDPTRCKECRNFVTEMFSGRFVSQESKQEEDKDETYTLADYERD